MTNKKPAYHELNQELEQIIADLQSDSIEIDEALAMYERATVLVKELEDYLKQAENKVTIIKASFEKQ